MDTPYPICKMQKRWLRNIQSYRDLSRLDAGSYAVRRVQYGIYRWIENNASNRIGCDETRVSVRFNVAGIHYVTMDFTIGQKLGESGKILLVEVSNLFNYFPRTGIDVSRDLRAMKGIN